MTLGGAHPLLRHTLASGAPRHFYATCKDDCGWKGTRTADCAEDVPLGRPCPRCGAKVRTVGS